MRDLGIEGLWKWGIEGMELWDYGIEELLDCGIAGAEINQGIQEISERLLHTPNS